MSRHPSPVQRTHGLTGASPNRRATVMASPLPSIPGQDSDGDTGVMPLMALFAQLRAHGATEQELGLLMERTQLVRLLEFYRPAAPLPEPEPEPVAPSPLAAESATSRGKKPARWASVCRHLPGCRSCRGSDPRPECRSDSWAWRIICAGWPRPRVGSGARLCTR